AIMMLVDIQASLPFIIFAITVVAFFGKGFWLLAIIVGFAGWERYARLARGLVLDAETVGYASALRVLGAGSWRIYVSHILPNIVGALIVQMTLNFPEVILLETGLSFLGLGVQPPLTSLGLLINESRNYLVLAWWMAAAPGAVIVLTTLSISLLGDWLRDIMDARLR
ncbi:MAG: ABC transporter permease, partial [Rhizobiaceae bacterium]|nr:ABC transporter permease [Rhizobiaceae bacterium]